jgi:hypothetical protein
MDKTFDASIIEFSLVQRNNGALVDIPGMLLKLVYILLGGKGRGEEEKRHPCDIVFCHERKYPSPRIALT